MIELLSNPWFIGPASGIGGGLVTLVVTMIIGKRGLFTFNVWHNRVAVAAEDAAFGSVRVLWNDEPVDNLFMSTAELRNESLRDYSNIMVRVWSSNSTLLTERSEFVGTTQSLRWAEEYAMILALPPGVDASDAQLKLWNSQREYHVPTMNRGQVVRIALLSSVRGPDLPFIFVEVVHPGVRVKYRVVPQQFLGVPQPAAALTGTLSGILVVALIVSFVQSVTVASILAFSYGAFAMIPGALMLRAWRWVREALGD